MCVLYDVMMCVCVCNRRKREQENHKQEAEGRCRDQTQDKLTDTNHRYQYKSGFLQQIQIQKQSKRMLFSKYAASPITYEVII